MPPSIFCAEIAIFHRTVQTTFRAIHENLLVCSAYTDSGKMERILPGTSSQSPSAASSCALEGIMHMEQSIK